MAKKPRPKPRSTPQPSRKATTPRVRRKASRPKAARPRTRPKATTPKKAPTPRRAVPPAAPPSPPPAARPLVADWDAPAFLPPPDEFSHIKARAFLTAFAAVGTVSRAASIAGVDRRCHSTWMKDLAGYADLFAAAVDIATDVLEHEARRRAVTGLVRYRFTKDGDPVAHPVTGEPYYELEYSDTMLALILKGRRGDVFKERREVTGKDGSPLMGPPPDLTKLSDEELEQLHALVSKAQRPSAALPPHA